MKKTVLFVIAALLAFTNVTSAQLVFDGGPDGTGTDFFDEANWVCLLYTSPSPRDRQKSRMPSSA